MSGLAYAADATPPADVLMNDMPAADTPPVEPSPAKPLPPGDKYPFRAYPFGAREPASRKPDPHIALLLPLKSAIFGTAAEAVRQGFMAAANQDPMSLPVRVYGSFDENSDIVTVYRHAVADGASAVAGPLTRSGVGALAAEKDIPVPTLTLNVAEQAGAPRLYFFGMAIEAEARQIAQLAARQGLRYAVVISVRTPLSKRLQSAFADEWAAQGGAILRDIEFDGDYALFAGIAAVQDAMIFLATDAARARLIRPYLPNVLPVYATSQIFAGNSDSLFNYDLNAIRFVDMPWLLQPDHPAVMIYPRAEPPLSADLERLYALGIDAHRLIRLMLADRVKPSMQLDGVSGDISLEGNIFRREPVPALFAGGRAQPVGAASRVEVPVFPDQPVSAP